MCLIQLTGQSSNAIGLSHLYTSKHFLRVSSRKTWRKMTQLIASSLSQGKVISLHLKLGKRVHTPPPAPKNWMSQPEAMIISLYGGPERYYGWWEIRRCRFTTHLNLDNRWFCTKLYCEARKQSPLAHLIQSFEKSNFLIPYTLPGKNPQYVYSQHSPPSCHSAWFAAVKVSKTILE